MKKILITGGSGFIGKALANKLNRNGYDINILSRNQEFIDNANIFWWNPSNNFIDDNALEGVTDIIHLAGSNIMEKEWSSQNKARILKSRTHSIDLLYNNIKSNNIKLNSFTSASAIGYYGAVTSNEIFNEETKPQQNDFAAILCQKWEKKANIFKDICRVSNIRIGLVLGKDGGIVEGLNKQPIISNLGNGKQWFPWVSLNDLTNLFIHIVENDDLNGIYNATAPSSVTSKEFIKLFTKKTSKFNLPITPAFALKMILGNRAELLLNGTRISSDKIINTGFKFEDTDLEKTLSKIV